MGSFGGCAWQASSGHAWPCWSPEGTVPQLLSASPVQERLSHSGRARATSTPPVQQTRRVPPGRSHPHGARKSALRLPLCAALAIVAPGLGRRFADAGSDGIGAHMNTVWACVAPQDESRASSRSSGYPSRFLNPWSSRRDAHMRPITAGKYVAVTEWPGCFRKLPPATKDGVPFQRKRLLYLSFLVLFAIVCSRQNQGEVTIEIIASIL